MPTAYDTVCTTSGGGVITADASGCASHSTLEAEFQQQVDSYSYALMAAREAIHYGNDPGIGTSVQTPAAIAADMAAAGTYWCKMYPGACPEDIAAIVAKYQDILAAEVAQYGFDMNGGYSSARDNQPMDQLFPTGVTPTPLVPSPNVASYSPSAGWRPPQDALPVTLSPTIPAFTSPTNAAQANTPASDGSGGLVGTAVGLGGSQGGAGTQQTRYTPTSNAAVTTAGLAGNNSKLLIILLIVAVAVIMFGRGD